MKMNKTTDRKRTEKTQLETNKENKKEETVGKKRQTYYIHLDLIEKIRAYAYWERLGISEVVSCALEQFLADKEIWPLLEKDFPLDER